jgi:hypothetical protein
MIKKFILTGLLFFIGYLANAQVMLPAYQGAFHAKPIVTASIANALDFDGVNDYVSIGADPKLNITGTITLAAWIYRNATGRYDCIIGKDNYGANDGYSLWIYNDDKLTLRFGSSRVYQSSSTIPKEIWTHVAATYDGTNAKLYVNGNLSVSYSALAPTTNSNNLYIGTPQDAIGNSLFNFYGKIDEVNIWNVARSQTDIQSSMTSELLGSETGLLAYYKFNQGIPAGNNTGISNLLDKTTNSFHGFLNNFSLIGATSNFVVGKTQSPVITNGLTLYLDPANSASYSGSGINWNDLSGSGNHATLVNSPTYNSTVAGGVFSFNGVNQYVSTSYIPSTTCSISIWFYNNLNYTDYNRGIFSTYKFGGPYNGIYMGTYSPSLNLSRDGNAGYSTSVTPALNINTWYNITVTSKPGAILVYLNGVLKSTINSSTSHADVLNIARSRFDANYWSGYIGAVMIYNKELTALEVTQNYNSLKSRYGY